MIILKFIDIIINYIAIFLIRIYQLTISPDKGIFSAVLKGTVCIHEPHCSEYSIRILKRYGFFNGIIKIMDRITSCTGGTKKKYDPEYYKVVFMSSAPIGVPFLEQLDKDKRFDIVGVVTNPDEKSGRGMKIKENIIKTEGEKIFGDLINGSQCAQSYLKNISKIILLHGKDKTSQDIRYPRLKESIEKIGIKCYIPDLPNSKDPDIKERLKEIDKLKPDENTIIIGHSRGGVAALRRLEQNEQKIKKTILIAANNGKSKYISHGENNKGFYTKDGYDFEKIKQNCKEFTVFHSKDDKWVEYKHGLNNVKGLNAKLYSFEEKNHFGGNEKHNYKAITMPQLVNEILYNDAYYPLIQTPKSLRLDSKKYAEEAHNFKLRLEAKKPDYIVVIAYGKIIPQHILDIPTFAPINIHGSILPKYRGASPIQKCLLENDKETGITIMKMDAGLDTGNMIDIKKFKIGFDWTSLDIIEKMKEIGPKYLNNTLWDYGKGLLGEKKQKNSQATNCGKIEKQDGLINPRKDSISDIYTKYRGYYLWPKVFFEFKHKNGKSMVATIANLKINETKYMENKDKTLFNNKSLNPSIEKISIKPEGKKSLNRESFANGYLD